MKVVYLGIFCLVQLLPSVLGRIANGSEAYSLPITFPTGDNLSDIPLLSGINIDITQKLQVLKTPIQHSSEAFALQVFSVSCFH